MGRQLDDMVSAAGVVAAEVMADPMAGPGAARLMAAIGAAGYGYTLHLDFEADDMWSARSVAALLAEALGSLRRTWTRIRRWSRGRSGPVAATRRRRPLERRHSRCGPGDVVRDQADWVDVWASVRRRRIEVGRSLAQWRRSRKLSQEKLAERVRYSTSTVRTAEGGRASPARPFWQAADHALDAGGLLLAAYDEVDAMMRAQRRVEAQAGATGEVTDSLARRAGAELRELVPHASPQHFLGGELRAWRLYRGLSLDRLGQMAGVNGSLLGKVEKAERTVTAAVIEACDTALDTGRALSRLLAYTATLTGPATVPAQAAPLPPFVIQIITDSRAADREAPAYPLPVSGSAQVVQLDAVLQRRR